MKIAFVISTFPPRPGGMGTVCYGEAARLQNSGHDVIVFTLDYGDAKIPAYPFKVVRLKSWFRLGDAGFLPQLRSRLKGYDLVHLHYPFYGGAEWVWLAKIFNGQKYVVTYHMDAAPASAFKKIVQKIYDFIFPGSIFKNAEKIIAIDKEHLQSTVFGKNIPAGKISEIGNAVDTAVFQPREIKAVALNLSGLEGKKIVLFVGNALRVKRLDVLLRAMAKLNDDVVLLVVGGNYDIESYTKLSADLGLSGRVIFAGPEKDPQILSDYYNLADCVAVPSDAESFSLVALEAMASGKPVVGSDIPAIRARIKDGVAGYLAAPGDPDDFAEKIERILTMPPDQRKKMGENGRSEALENYGWAGHVKKLENLYLDII